MKLVLEYSTAKRALHLMREVQRRASERERDYEGESACATTNFVRHVSPNDSK